MSYFSRFIIVLVLFFPFRGFAHSFFVDALYWKTTEAADWVLRNNLNADAQTIHYETIKFKFKPGFRVGMEGGCKEELNTRLYYTKYKNTAQASTTGNLVSTFLGGKTSQPNTFYQTGQIKHAIHFNMVDLDFSQCFIASETLLLKPLIGLRGGSINQRIVNGLQGSFFLIESVKNNFKGLGPKIGIESQWLVYCRNHYQFTLCSDIATSYLLGRWNITDLTQVSDGRIIDTIVGKRRHGAFALQAMLGLGMNYECFAIKLGYELADWFNQYQVFNDGTGAQHTDLILQGLSLKLSYNF